MRKRFILFILLALTACAVKDQPVKQEEEKIFPENKQPISTEQDQSFIGEEQKIIKPDGNTICERVQVPDGFERTAVEEGSFAHYLRNLPLKPHGSKVHYYNGGIKSIGYT